MKKFSWILALLAALALVFVGAGCSSGGGDDDDDDDDTVQELVVLFDLATDEFVQALSIGAITNNDFYGPEGGTANIPLVAAGSPTLEIVAGPGEQAVALKITNAATWGDGIDLPYSKFLFKAGDKIIIEGTVDSLPAGNRIQINKSVGSENATIGGTDTRVTAEGPFKMEVELAAADVTALRGGSPAGLRFEMRSVTGLVATITNIHVEGMRGAEKVDMSLADFDIEGSTAQFAGDVEGWTITAKDGFSEGEITVFYEGIDPTVYEKSETVPQDEGTYKVTFDIAAAGIFNAGSNFEAGTLTVMPAPVDASVKALFVSGEGSVIKEGTGVEFTKTGGYQNSYTQFEVDFGTGKSIADYTGISLNFLGISGDLGWKNFVVVAQEAAFSGSIEWEAADAAKMVAPKVETNYNGTSEKAFSWTFTDEIKTALADKQKVHLAIIFHAGATGTTGGAGSPTKFEIYDVLIASASTSPLNLKFTSDPSVGTVTIAADPAGEELIVGVTLKATVDGESGVTYQWKRGTTNVGTNSDTFETDQPGNYSVTVSKDGFLPKTSNTLTVAALVVICDFCGEEDADCECVEIEGNLPAPFIKAGSPIIMLLADGSIGMQPNANWAGVDFGFIFEEDDVLKINADYKGTPGSNPPEVMLQVASSGAWNDQHIGCLAMGAERTVNIDAAALAKIEASTFGGGEAVRIRFNNEPNPMIMIIKSIIVERDGDVVFDLAEWIADLD